MLSFLVSKHVHMKSNYHKAMVTHSKPKVEGPTQKSRRDSLRKKEVARFTRIRKLLLYPFR